MITPHIFIGVGGSGGKTLRAIKRELREILLATKEWGPDRGFPEIWQFLHIDTPSIQDGQSFPAPLLRPDEYVGLVQPGGSLDAVILNIESKPWEPLVREEILTPLPKRGEYTGQIDKGAGQYRGIGRTVALARLDQIKQSVELANNKIQGARAQSQLVELGRIFGAQVQLEDVQTKVYLVSSLAGGSGSGQFMDVCEAVKAAVPGKGWVNDQTAILFAPDVFNDPKISVSAGIAPNSLATLNEVISGYWRRKRTDISAALYNRFGFAQNEDGTFNVGPKSIYLVGKTNGLVSFDSQDDVYNAAAVSLAKLVVDSSVRENIDHYIKMNEQTVGDPLRIKVSNHLSAPFNAIGFARVSLGDRSFARYSGQRLARAAVNQIVYGHREGMGKANEEQWVSKIVADEWEKFWGKLELDSKAIVEEIQPVAKRQMFRASLTGDLQRQSGLAVDNKGLKSAAAWVQDILRNTKKLTNEQERAWRSYREVDLWSENTQKKILSFTNESISRIGLRPTIQLLKQLRDQLIVNSKQEDILASVIDTSLQNDLSDILRNSGASAQAQLGSDSQAVQSMLDLSGKGATSSLMQDTKKLGHALEADLARNMLQPLIDELDGKYKLLLSQIMDPSFHSEGKSIFDTWPSGDGVPNQFKPAPNELYLIDWAEFESVFGQLLVESVNGELGKVRAAVDTSVRLLIQGAYSGRTTDLNDEWNVEDGEVRRWIPRDGSESAPRTWSGSFAGDLDEWEDIAQRFVHRKETSMARYLSQTLAQWLAAENEDASERQRRENSLVEQFSTVLKNAKPFVQVNNVVLPLVHPNSSLSYSSSISTLPIALSAADSGSIGGRLKDVLSTAGMWNTEVEKRFQPESSVKEVDVFVTLSSALHHVVFDNLMIPISQAWKISSPDKAQRQSFLLRRRGRNIPETIPLAPEVLDQFIRGWFVAKALGRLKSEQTLQGLKLGIWNQDPASPVYNDFPHPSYTAGEIQNIDVIPIIAQSVSLALAQVNETKRLDPMFPYWSVMDLGGDVEPYTSGTPELPGAISAALAMWIESGTLPYGAPMPSDDRAGNPNMTLDQRKARILNFLQNEQDDFTKNAFDLAPGVKHTSLVWEMRREILKAIAGLRTQIAQVGSQGSLI